MKKNNRCKELFEAEEKNGGKMPSLQELLKRYSDMLDKAESITSKELIVNEFKRLFQQKTLLIGAPVLFGFTVMGLFVAGC